MARRENMVNEKVYRFISDPGHKENLSGRVRAACLNCRRKKMKCSGEVPCNTCEEKEIVCEGLVERKRPAKNAGRRSRASSSRRSSQDFASDDGTAQSKRNSFDSSSTRMDWNEEPVHRPTAYLRKRATGDSEDSGYASGTQSRRENSAALALQLDTQFPFSFNPGQRASSGCNDTAAISPSRNGHQNWNLASQLELTGLSATENADAGLSQSAPPTTAATPLKSLGWLDATDHPKGWVDNDTSAQAATKLLTAAQALEQQAMSLRRLADQEPAEVRRQTINLPIYNQYTTPMDSPAQLLPGPFDDLSLIPGERTSRTGLTPFVIDVNSWWDVNPGLSASYGFPSYTAADQQSGTVIPPVQAAEPVWPYTPTSFNLAPFVEGPSNKPAKVAEQVSDARQAAQRYRGQSQQGCKQLYPWPE